MTKELNTKLINGDCLEEMKNLPENSVDSICCDPPYELGFMGKSWDSTGIANNVELWKECLRVLKPGGHLLAFSGTRTYHRMAVAIEDAGFEVRDMIEWVYGSGFPKSLNIGKAVDKHGGVSVGWFGQWLRNWRKENNITQKQVSILFPSKTGGLTGCVANWELGLNIPTNEQFNLICKTFNLPFENLEEAEREVVGKHEAPAKSIYTQGEKELSKDVNITKGTSEWEGWGTALKPAHEPICMARKPLAEKTVAENVLKWGTGGIDIDGSRVGTEQRANIPAGPRGSGSFGNGGEWGRQTTGTEVQGRFPANLIHDNSEEVRECFPDKSERFFKSIIYIPKASKAERNRGCEGLEEKAMGRNQSSLDGGKMLTGSGNERSNTRQNNHPTVKPIALMEYLINMITPKEGTVLDPFMGSGTTGIAAKNLNRGFIGIELEKEYFEIAKRRIESVPETLF